MWRGTEEILSDERAQSKKNKITNHVNVCGTDVGDVPRCILTGSVLSSKGCFTPEEGADSMLEHGSRCVSDSSCFFYCCYHNLSILYTFDSHPACPAAWPCVWWHPCGEVWLHQREITLTWSAAMCPETHILWHSKLMRHVCLQQKWNLIGYLHRHPLHIGVVE